MGAGVGYAEGPSEEEDEEEADDGRDEDFAPAAGGGSGRSRRPLMNPVCSRHMHIWLSICDTCRFLISTVSWIPKSLKSPYPLRETL